MERFLTSLDELEKAGVNHLNDKINEMKGSLSSKFLAQSAKQARPQGGGGAMGPLPPPKIPEP